MRISVGRPDGRLSPTDEWRARPGRLTLIQPAGSPDADGATGDTRRLRVARPLGVTFDRMSNPDCESDWARGRRGTLGIDRKINRLAQAFRWRMSRVLEPEEDCHDDARAR
jgi:hypothetical protein